MKVWLHGLFSVIFWLWNLTFLGMVYLGILPWLAIPLIQATVEGIIPLEFTLAVTGAIAIPTVCTVIGTKLRKQPLQLIRLFYGVEAPLFTLCLVRLFMLREMTAASNLMVGTALLAMAAFALELFYGYAHRDRKLAWLQLATHSLMLLMGLYLGALLLFYVVPFTVFFATFLGSVNWVEIINILQYDPWMALLWIPLSLLFWGFSATLFIAMPSALATFHIYSGYKIIQQFTAQYGRKWALFGSGVVVTAWMVLFLSFQQQPQIQAFKSLENPPSTDRERQELLAKSNSIRQGLLNAYLLSYRYLSTHQDNNHIGLMYQDLMGIDEATAQVLQNWYNRLMSPFLYQGSRSDIEKAATLYQEFFDTPIQKGEAKTILKAVQSTFNREEAKAGLLNINEQRVLLTQQEITVTERGDWADVELYEVYENQTPQDEEVFYYFSLPESAVLTGVWLNETADRSDRYVFQISPRGAAQQVYNDQVRRNIDPALLEQVGPRQYRLRVFPVPARLTSWDNPNPQVEQPKQHLWLTYKVMQSPQGWAMPQLAEKRNVFWNRKTQRQYNGEPVKRLGDAWMPEFLPATDSPSVTAHQVTLPGDYQISAQPLTETDYILPQGKRIAVIVDRSYSMRSHAKEVTETVNWLKQNGFADNRFDNNDADIYLTASPGVIPLRLDNLGELNPAKITYYGSLNYQQMLQQFQELQGGTTYDAVALISDRGSYELAKDSPDLLTLSSPLWMVHLGGLPRAYDDGTLQAIQGTGGGVSTDLETVLQRIATTAKLGPSTVSVVDGYRWVVEKPAKADLATLPQKLASATVPDKAALDSLAARQLILALSKQMDAASIADLDAIHALAKHYEIVSPYSSAIVLVNEDQKQQLKEAESRSDRFEREIEDGKEELQQPQDMMSVPVPEPHQWLGMISATGLLIFAKRKWGKKSVG